ncbi:hypothetical protein [uncultured Rikenella sp.]|uniref:hypothetical protein n=1 Tax=uncultured Rikenella sp. TaxID=368003 RepID=UPI0025CC22FB|nr:hypothetical protein [uncultured Rikenella sp.]
MSAFSAPGHRGSNEGALWSVGSNGYSWSSAICGIHGVFLRFPTQNLSPCYVNYRDHGFQLRCLSE